MHLLRLGCFTLLMILSTSSSALIDEYYSQAVDIDYALLGENESIRVTLERALKKFLKMVTTDEGESTVGFNMSYYDGDEDGFTFEE